nr:MAG TPA: hypothetical protein [Caudoviricetes sp.]
MCSVDTIIHPTNADVNEKMLPNNKIMLDKCCLTIYYSGITTRR